MTSLFRPQGQAELRKSYVGVLFNAGVSRIVYFRTGGVVRSAASITVIKLSVMQTVAVHCERVSLD